RSAWHWSSADCRENAPPSSLPAPARARSWVKSSLAQSVKHVRGNGKTRGAFPSRAVALSCGFGLTERGRSSVVERQLPKLYVAGSIPAARSIIFVGLADFQLEGNRDLADDESAGNCFLSLLGRHRGRSDIQSPASAGASRRRGSPDEEKSLSCDGQPRAGEDPGGAEIKAADGRWIAARTHAECTRSVEVEVLIFNAKDHVDQRALVDHVVEAAARIPAVVAARDPVSRTNATANTGDARAM